MILYSCKNIVKYSLLFGIFFKNLRICSAKFGKAKSVWAHVTDWMRLLNYEVQKNRQMMLWNFLIISYYRMLNQIFLGLSHKDFSHIAQARWKWPSEFQLPISVLIRPVYHLELTIKLYAQPKTTRISKRLYLLLVHLPHAKSKSDKRRKLSDLLFTP